MNSVMSWTRHPNRGNNHLHDLCLIFCKKPSRHTLEHRVEPSDHINALCGVVSQSFSVKVRERGEKNDAPRRQGKFAQHSAEVRRQFL
jgi:hypothetical protein